MMKKVMAIVVCLAMTVMLIPSMALVGDMEKAQAYSIKMPNNNGKTNNTSYVLGEGTDAQVTVVTDWRSTSLSPTASMTPKYIAIHCTGAYPSTSTALANHNYGKTASNACWHYTVGHDSIYQLLADNRQGWHVGTSYTGAPSNSNSIGLELAVNNFPATETFGGEKWTDGTAIMEWWDNQFHQTVKNAAYLTIVLCERWGLDYTTRVKMHWDSMSYGGGTYGKDCPMQMRATYNKETNAFTPAGGYKDGRDGYFWQIFWGYLGEYANGATHVGTGTTATKIGTYQVKASDGLNVRSGASTANELLGTLETGEIVEVTQLNGNWGYVTASDGLQGWASIVNYGDYIGVDAQAYTTTAITNDLGYTFNGDGSLVINNKASDRGIIDLTLPQAIGNLTTPYMSLQITPNSGSGYFFGITQAGSGYWMMRDCQSGDQLVQEDNAPYMTNTEQLEIDLKEWWTTQDWQIDTVRIYVAPQSSITVNYFYFADAAGSVTDMRFNLRAAASNVNLMNPDTLRIVDETKTGSYTYNNGMLTVVSEEANGYEVAMDVNLEYTPETLHRLLYSVDARVRYDIEMIVTTSDGDRSVSLVSDFWPGLCNGLDGNYLPAAEQSAGLDLYSVYTYNNVLPADGLSTIKTITVKVGGVGTVIVNAIQIAANDRLLNFPDGISKTDSSPKTVEPEPTPTPEEMGDVNGDGTITTTDARMTMLYAIGGNNLTEAQVLLADYNGDGQVTTSDARVLMLYALTHA